MAITVVRFEVDVTHFTRAYQLDNVDFWPQPADMLSIMASCPLENCAWNRITRLQS
jgi:hypothetical protein